MRFGKGVDREAGVCAFDGAGDVGLADVGVDLHLGQIGGDQEQGGGLKARGHGLAGGDIARHHRAVHRRDDVGVIQIDLGGLQRRGLLGDRGRVEFDERARLIVGVARGVGGVVRDRVLAEQDVVALVG